MARASKVGRNDPCPCGSGKKHKNCCAGKSTQKISTVGWVTIATMITAAAIVLYFVVISPPSGNSTARTCPPGQVWNAAHGHCDPIG